MVVVLRRAVGVLRLAMMVDMVGGSRLPVMEELRHGMQAVGMVVLHLLQRRLRPLSSVTVNVAILATTRGSIFQICLQMLL